MAGRNQHYIPRLLMRGFIVPGIEGEKVFCYEKDHSPDEPKSIKRIASDDDFYSEPHDNALDDSITAAETRDFGPVIHRARTGRPFKDGDELNLRRFVVHMILRTDSTRSIAGGVTTSATQGAQAAFSEPDLFSRSIHNRASDLEEMAHNLIAELQSRGAPPPTAEERARFVQMLPAYMAANAEVAGQEIAQLVQIGLFHAPPVAADIGATIQKKVLSADLAPPLKVSDLEAYTLSVEQLEGDLILSDDPVLAFDAAGRPQRAMMHDNRPLLYMLPISSQRAVILRDGKPVLPSVSQLNAQSAAQSHSFFVAHQIDPELTRLAATIGTFKSSTETMDWRSHFIENVSKPN